MATLVKFNRKFTQAQLSAAVGTSSIAGTAVVDGTWYIAKTGALALYVGSVESGSDATLKLVAEINGNVLTGKDITNLINSYIANPSPDSTATLITKVDSAVKDKDGNAIDTTYLKKSGGTMTGNIEFGVNSATWGSGNAEITYVGEQDDELIITSPVVRLKSSDTTKSLEIGANGLTYDGYNVLNTGAQTLTAAEKTQVLTNIGAEPAGTASGLITNLDGTITKTAGSASASTAASAYQKVPVVTGFVLRERDGKLIETSGTSTPLSTVSTTDVDVAGSAQKALADAKTYADGLISGLGAIMRFQGTVDTETTLKALTNVTKGDVYVVTADGSEWVATDDIGSTADASKWEKFGTTDVSGALYKGSNTLTSGTLVIADGTDGKMKAISDADMATRLADEAALTGKYKVLQTAVADSGTGYVSKVTQNTQGVITVTKTALPSGTGSVGTASSAADAWKTVVHDVSLSGHTLSGNTKSIPASAAGTSASNGTDGYMTKAQAYKLAGIADGAEVNQNAFSTMRIRTNSSTYTDVGADTKTDTFEISQGTNITLTADATNDKVTIASPNVGGSVGSTSSAADAWKTVVHDVAGSNHSITGNTKSIPAATSSSDGYMTSTQVGVLTAVAAALAWEE